MMDNNRAAMSGNIILNLVTMQMHFIRNLKIEKNIIWAKNNLQLSVLSEVGDILGILAILYPI